MESPESAAIRSQMIDWAALDQCWLRSACPSPSDWSASPPRPGSSTNRRPRRRGSKHPSTRHERPPHLNILNCHNRFSFYAADVSQIGAHGPQPAAVHASP
jgi:hypothetical protein